MKGTTYCLLCVLYLVALIIPIYLRHDAITYIHVALYAVFSLVILAGATIDLHYYILPDEGAVVLLILGMVYNYILDRSFMTIMVHIACVGAITYGLRFLSHNGFGLGDIKWFMAISTWLTLWEIIVFFYISFCVGSLYLFVTGYRKQYIPFGPFLCFGAWCALHMGSYIEFLYIWVTRQLQ